MSATVTSIGSPRMRRQFLVVPHVITCCGTRTVVAMGTGNCVSSDVMCAADVGSWPSVGDARGSRLRLRTYTDTHEQSKHCAYSTETHTVYVRFILSNCTTA